MLTHVKYRLEKNLNERAVFVLFASDRFRSDMIFQQKCKSERLFSRSSRVNSRMVTLGDLTHGNGWARLLPNGGHECRVAGRSGAWAEPAALSLGSSVLPGDRLATAPRVRARPESPLGRLGGSFRRSLRCRSSPMPPASTAFGASQDDENPSPILNRGLPGRALRRQKVDRLFGSQLTKNKTLE